MWIGMALLSPPSIPDFRKRNFCHRGHIAAQARANDVKFFLERDSFPTSSCGFSKALDHSVERCRHRASEDSLFYAEVFRRV